MYVCMYVCMYMYICTFIYKCIFMYVGHMQRLKDVGV